MIKFSIYDRSMNIVQNLMGAPIFFQLLFFTGFIAFGLLSLDQGVQDLSFEIVQSLNCLLVQLYLNFTFCYHADNMARRTSSIANIVYHSYWYMIPPEQSRILILIMRRAQVPFVLNGFQLFNCSLPSFQSVSFDSEDNHFPVVLLKAFFIFRSS